MRVLWICNFMLPAIALKLKQQTNHKEGWVTGLASVIQKRKKNNGIKLAVAFPVKKEMDGCYGEVTMEGEPLCYYGFYEDISQPQNYDSELEGRILNIMEDFCPDVVHCFGTEFSHTLAASRVCPDPQKLLIGIQGLCSVYAAAFMANLPMKVINSATFRDLVKKDTILIQREKYEIRGEREIQAIRNAGHITGRTEWDYYYSKLWNPDGVYHKMNETLRPIFYVGQWEAEKCVAHRIFLSQGDYPIKGLHYLLLSLLDIRKVYPDVTVHIAGNSIARAYTLKDRIKLSAYGKYIRNIIKQYDLEEQVRFLGSLTAEQMKEQYLEADLYVCCSSIENSPNSLGEAMLLGVPCVAARVGGIPSLFRHEEDGLLFDGFVRKPEDADEPMGNRSAVYDNRTEAAELKGIVNNLTQAVLTMWSDQETAKEYGQRAREHALNTHDKEANYRKLMEIYTSIVQGK